MIAAGTRHSAALTESGELIIWGWKSRLPRRYTGATKIAAWKDHTAALDTEGRVKLLSGAWRGLPWGIEPACQLDLLVTGHRRLYESFVHQLLSRLHGSKIKKSTRGKHATLLLLKDGSVRGWRHDGADTIRLPRDLEDVDNIACTHDLAIATSSDGRVWTWDTSGDQSRLDKSTQLTPDGHLSSVAAGTEHFACIDAKRNAWIWRNSTDDAKSAEHVASDAIGLAADEHWTAIRLRSGFVQIHGNGCGTIPWKLDDEQAEHLLERHFGQLTWQFLSSLAISYPHVVRKHLRLNGGCILLLASGMLICKYQVDGDGLLRCWNRRLVTQSVSGVRDFAASDTMVLVLKDSRTASITDLLQGESTNNRVPEDIQGEIDLIHGIPQGVWVKTRDGELHIVGQPQDLNSCPWQVPPQVWERFVVRYVSRIDLTSIHPRPADDSGVTTVMNPMSTD